jgi:large subunit ribosomal protein L25
MEEITMKAFTREGLGKGEAGRTRKSGFVPAELYGPGLKKNLHLKLGRAELEKILNVRKGANFLLNLDIEGEKPRTAILKKISRDPVKSRITHVDLMNILKDRKIAVEVPVVVAGRAAGVALGGILHQEVRKISVECLPHEIPDSIEVDVTPLNIGQSIHISDLRLKEGLKILDDAKLTVALVAAPAAEEAAPKTAEEITTELKESFAEKEKPQEEGKKEKE